MFQLSYKAGVAKWSDGKNVHAIIFTGRDDSKGLTERLEIKGDKRTWIKDSKQFADFKNTHFFSTVTFENRVYSFGGATYQNGQSGSILKTVFVYNGKWSRDRDLAVPRQRHQSIVVGEKIVHVGGSGEYSFEIWTSMGKGSWVQPAYNTELKLRDWSKYPNLFAVSSTDYE